MRKIIFLGVLLAAIVGPLPRPAYALMTIRERLEAPVKTLMNPVTPALGEVTVGYARTFQKSKTENQAVAILPLFDWGIFSANLLGGSGDVSEFFNGRGILGIGGGVHANRVLAASFPEIKNYLKGPVPFTGGTITFETEIGVGGGWNLTDNEFVSMIYTGLHLKH